MSGLLSGMTYKEPNAVELRVALLAIEPSIWRRLVVPWTFHLGQLHQIIQAAFGWNDSHLHEFHIGGLRYSDPSLVTQEFDDDARVYDEAEVRLLDFHREPGSTITYVYDFGDNWRHEVTFERLLSLDPLPKLATCIGGARARPPEDVGGTSGYENFIAVMRDPDDDEHADTKRWCGGHFDPEWFDLEMTDRDVRAALRGTRRIRMKQPVQRRKRKPDSEPPREMPLPT